MRKKILLIVCILISLSLLSCHRADNNGPTTSPAATGTPDVAPSPSIAPDAGYSITDDAYAEGDSIIRYPQIEGLTDMDRQDRINTLLKDDATAIAEEGGTFDISYTAAWAGPRLLSVRYSGVRTMPEAAYPNNIFYTTNVNITDGTKVRLINMITVEPSFIKKINNESEFVTEDTGLKEAEDLIREAVEGYNLYGALANADNGYGPDNPDYCFSYFTETALGISFSVPHAIGDHAEFEISYPILEGNYKSNAIWEDFGVITGGKTDAGVSQSDLYGDWVVSSHIASNPMGSTYGPEDIEAMIGKELTYEEDRAAFDGEELAPPYYQMTKVAKAQYEADNSLTFADLGIDGDSVTDITVYIDAQFQNVWVIPACFVFIVDKDHLIIRGDGEFFGLTRK